MNKQYSQNNQPTEISRGSLQSQDFNKSQTTAITSISETNSDQNEILQSKRLGVKSTNFQNQNNTSYGQKKMKIQCSWCQTERKDISSECQVCHGKKIIPEQSSLVNFFNYLISYKCLEKQTYTPKAINKKSILKKKVEPSIKTMSNIHLEYYCNSCYENQNQKPIQGARFTCRLCQDFDLCEKCFSSKGHSHSMEKIIYSTIYKKKSKMTKMFQQYQSKSRQTLHKTYTPSMLMPRLQEVEKLFSSSLK